MNHSFHYFANSVTFDRLNNNIIDKKSGVLVLKVCNLCNFTDVYTPVLERTMIKKKSLVNYKKWFGFREISGDTAYNYKIRVDINYKLIREYIQCGYDIPQRNFLFKLLRRNVKRLDDLIHTIEPHSKPIQTGELITYFSDNIIECDNLYFDIELERIYLSPGDIVRNKHNIIGNTKFWFYNTYSYLYDFFKNTSEFIVLTKNTDIYDKIAGILDIKRINTSKNFNSNNSESNKYILDITELNVPEDDIINFVEKKRYEYSFLKEIDLQKKMVLPQLMNFSTVVIDASVIETPEYSNLVKSFLDNRQVILLNKYFYKYRISDIANWFNFIGSNAQMSRDFLRKILKLSSIQQVKLDTSKFKSEVINSNKLEDDYLLKFSNTYNFNIDEFNSLPFNYLKQEYTSVSLIPDEPCSICYDEITCNSIGKSKNCQHMFCYSCLEKSVKLNGKCPVCREPTKAQKGILGDLSIYYGEKIKFIKKYKRNNSDKTLNLVSMYNTTCETLKEIFSGETINIYNYEKIETIDTSNKSFIFMESLSEENRYLKYLLSDSKCIFLNYKHN